MSSVSKVLIANRGEIAVRIIRACKELGCKTVAVYSEADRMSPHVRMANEAYCIGPGPAVDSYLRLDKLIEVAKQAKADSVHPGYGFLAENADAQAAFEDAGIEWIGPPEMAIRMMGDKLTARSTVEAAGLPLVPGIGKTDTLSDEDLKTAAAKVGYPLLVKAAAGGGGKGMRIVREPKDLTEGIRIARLEAKSSFGDDRVYLERFVTNAHHVEIQILGDKHGNLIHLCERDCSLQRRHQKLIEESPSPVVDEQIREKMGAAALKAAAAVGYYSAGTVEFVFDSDTREFFFLEMNTRLQVEHTITERVTGVDIVKEMILIARGEKLQYRQEDIKIQGHSIECRILAEDPWQNFMPSIGTISGFNLPCGPGVRTDTGVGLGSEVTPYYDSLLAKIVIWDTTREEAIIRTCCALEEFQIAGIDTTIPFYIQLLNTQTFKEGKVHTRFLEDEYLFQQPDSSRRSLTAAVAATLLAHRRARQASVLPQTATTSLWKSSGRSNQLARRL
ncbi:Carbamoyl-phosphate synthase L chain, ATP binding domain protein [Verrucomicrobiia bacterium DG1235]|nr:Carbamoyl-phosphate synthase L chain, ATP binding domain protein [Verrucomicrobiae bacterium DG1235]